MCEFLFLSLSRAHALLHETRERRGELEEKSFYSSLLVFINQTDFDLFE